MRTLDAQNGNSGLAVDSRRRHRAGQLRQQRAGRRPLAPRRLRTDHPRRRPRVGADLVQPASDMLLIESGDIRRRASPPRSIDAGRRDVVARPDGLIVPAGSSDDTLLGVTSSDAGTSRPPSTTSTTGTGARSATDPSSSAAHDRGERPRHRQGADARPLPGRHRQLARPVRHRRPSARATIPVNGLVSWAISRTGDRIAAGTAPASTSTTRSPASRSARSRSRSARRLHHCHRPTLRQLARRRARPVRPRHTRTDPDVRRQPRARVRRRRHRRRFAHRHNGGDHRVVSSTTSPPAPGSAPRSPSPEDQQNQVRLSLDGRWLALGGERER